MQTVVEDLFPLSISLNFQDFTFKFTTDNHIWRLLEDRQGVILNPIDHHGQICLLAVFCVDSKIDSKYKLTFWFV